MSVQKCKICRRAGEKLFLKGEKCFTPKCIFEKRPTPPGKPLSERKHRSNVTEYGMQLKEKQKIRNVYGISEKQFRRYVDGATQMPGSSSEHLFENLERRLDNIIFRTGLARSRTQARQMVSHGHFLVGTRKLTIPSYKVANGQVVSIRPGSRTSPLFVDAKEKLSKHSVPLWISVDPSTLTATIKGVPRYDKNEVGFNFQTVIEFYSR